MPPVPTTRGTVGYPLKLREAAIQMVLLDRVSARRVARMLRVRAPRTIRRWVAHFVATGRTRTTFEHGIGRTGTVPVMTQWALATAIWAIANDSTVLVDEVLVFVARVTAVVVHEKTMLRWLHRAGLTHKVVWVYPREARRAQALRYWAYFANNNFYLGQLVFIDEAYCDLRTPNRRRGWSPSFLRDPRYSVLLAVHQWGILDYDIVGGAANGNDMFAWLATSLMDHLNPWPGPNSVLIMDGASIHRNGAFQALLTAMGVVVVTLPPYSPWLNIAELAINCVKGDIRTARGAVGNDVLPVLIASLQRRRFLHMRPKLMDIGYGQYCR